MGSPRKRSKTAPHPPTKPKRVGRGASSYVHFEGLLSPAQLERARAFTASEPVQDALEKAELFNGPGASRDRKSRVAWLDRAGHSDEDSELSDLDGDDTIGFDSDFRTPSLSAKERAGLAPTLGAGLTRVSGDGDAESFGGDVADPSVAAAPCVSSSTARPTNGCAYRTARRPGRPNAARRQGRACVHAAHSRALCRAAYCDRLCCANAPHRSHRHAARTTRSTNHHGTIPVAAATRRAADQPDASMVGGMTRGGLAKPSRSEVRASVAQPSPRGR